MNCLGMLYIVCKFIGLICFFFWGRKENECYFKKFLDLVGMYFKENIWLKIDLIIDKMKEVMVVKIVY